MTHLSLNRLIAPVGGQGRVGFYLDAVQTDYPQLH